MEISTGNIHLKSLRVLCGLTDSPPAPFIFQHRRRIPDAFWHFWTYTPSVCSVPATRYSQTAGRRVQGTPFSARSHIGVEQLRRRQPGRSIYPADVCWCRLVWLLRWAVLISIQLLSRQPQPSITRAWAVAVWSNTRLGGNNVLLLQLCVRHYRKCDIEVHICGLWSS